MGRRASGCRRGRKAELDALTAQARKAGFPIKVAIIASQYDLGAVTSFFTDPRGYARFLEHEIRTNSPQPLLVVMPAGIGTASVSAKAAAALSNLPDLRDEETDGLVRAAITAVRRMALASGQPLSASPGAPGTRAGRSHAKGSAGGGAPLALVFAPVGLLALAAMALSLRRRGERDEAER